MRKKRFIVALIATLIIAPFVANADTYKVLAFRNCNPTYKGKKLERDMLISDPKLLKENWTDAQGSKYIKLEAQSDRAIHVLTPPKKGKIAAKKSDDGALTMVWDSFVSPKKCSTRAPENELAGGLADNLSRTFYVLIPQRPTDEVALKFASNLLSGSLLRCSYRRDGQSHSFDAPLIDGAFIFPYSVLPAPDPDSDRTIFRITVDYITPDSQQIPLTTSMILILISE